MLHKENADLRTSIKYTSEAVETEKIAKQAPEENDLDSSFNLSSKMGGSTIRGGAVAAVGKKIEHMNI